MKTVLNAAALLGAILFAGCVGAPPTPCTACDGQCVDLKVDSKNCGACGTACSTGSVCRDGACAVTCQPTQSVCGSKCVDVKVDPANCGACGTACGAGETCQAGSCATSCPTGQAVCGGACVTLDTNADNCGSCGRACPTGAVCRSGQCAVQCQPGQLSCDGGACINGQTENANCGACGITCASGQVCSNGACGTSCGGTLSTCGGDGGVRTCADTMTDNVNCGACGVTCGAGQVCRAGACRATCGVGQDLCTQNTLPYCANFQTENSNCGACGTSCAAGESCQSGKCLTTCGTTQSLCGADAGVGGTCVNLQADGLNCGSCGTTCAAGQSCLSGNCVGFCGAGLSLCSSDAGTPLCANLDTDPGSCGQCGLACPGGCQGGFCPAAPTTITTAVNLSTTNLGTRTCSQGGEMVRYSVTALTATTATVSAAPATGCLSAGDEVLVINLQGTPAAITNVGNYELRRVVSVTGSTVTFTAAKTKFYGDTAGADTNLGVARTNQRVVLQRVPAFGTLAVAAGGNLTADLWNGVSGGVFALRATSRLQLSGNGTIDMRGKGFVGGAATTVINSTGQQGESIGGLGISDDHNSLGGGGAGRGDNTSCPLSTTGVAGGGGGHATWGGKGSVYCGGAGGAPVGLTSLGKILLGSGGASGGTDTTLNDNPPGGAGGRGGGIVMVLTPSIEAAGGQAVMDISGLGGQGDPAGTNCVGNTSTTSCWDLSGPGGGGAGGSFFTSAVSFPRRDTVRFEGGPGGDGNVGFAGIGGRGSYGRVYPLPSTCSDVNALAGDGEKIFAFGGDSTQPYLAWCTGVGTSSPAMYLTLNNRGGSQNFALYDPRAWSGANTIITTRFQRVRFDPVTQHIIPTDYTFSTSTGTATGGPFGGTTVTRWPYGSSGDCNAGADTGAANVDLRGLPLAVSTTTVWSPAGAGPSGTSPASYDRQVISITGGGFCGENRPSFPGGEIELTYLAPRSTCQAIKTAVPAAADGVYTVQPDPALAPLPVYCDMTNLGGGWMLLEDSGPAGGGNANYAEAMPVISGTGSWVPMSVARLLAGASTQINVRTTNQAVTRSFTTVANQPPIVNLRNGQQLNFANWALADYTGPVTAIVPNPLPFSCTPVAKGWPNVYHACNNGNGFHWLDGISRFNNLAPTDEPLQIWVR